MSGTKRDSNWRRRLLQLHRWLGVTLGLYLFVICLSGTLAVFGHELDVLLGPAYPSASGPVNWDAVEASLADEYRYGAVHTLRLEPDTGQLWAAVETAHGQRIRAWLHPTTGVVLDERNYVDIKYFLRQFHKTLLMPKGLYLVTPAALVLLYSTLSGVLIYPSFWRHLFRLRLRRDALVAYADTHRTIGLWAVIFGVLIAVTGSWYLLEVSARDLGTSVEPVRPQVPIAAAPRAPLRDLVAAAKGSLPNLRIERIVLGERSTDPIWVEGRREAWFVRSRANRVYLHPRDASVIEVWREEEQSVLHRWSDMADPLHFGNFAGLWSKGLWFLFGGVLCVAVAAGPWLARARARRRRATRTSTAPHWQGWAIGISAVTFVILMASAVLSVTAARLPILSGRPVPHAVADIEEVLITRTDGETASTYRLVSPRPLGELDLALRLGGEVIPLVPGRPAKGPRAHEVKVDWAGSATTLTFGALVPGQAHHRPLTRPPLPIPVYVKAFIGLFVVLTLTTGGLWMAAMVGARSTLLPQPE
ncbi:MAG: PepSY-associated TM helix domain-containing protein [Myxococcota bacterium]